MTNLTVNKSLWTAIRDSLEYENPLAADAALETLAELNQSLADAIADERILCEHEGKDGRNSDVKRLRIEIAGLKKTIKMVKNDRGLTKRPNVCRLLVGLRRYVRHIQQMATSSRTNVNRASLDEWQSDYAIRHAADWSNYRAQIGVWQKAIYRARNVLSKDGATIEDVVKSWRRMATYDVPYPDNFSLTANGLHRFAKHTGKLVAIREFAEFLSDVEDYLRW